MKTISIAVLLLAAVASGYALDDGRYRPEVHGGNDGKYYHDSRAIYEAPLNGVYHSLAERNSKYGSVYDPYPTNVQALNRDLLAPFVTYGDSVEVLPAQSVVQAVTYRPFSTTYRPTVYSTPRPTVYSTTRPAVYSTTVRPFAYSTQAPAVVARTIYNTDNAAKIIRQDSDVKLNEYNFSYQTDNGIAAGEQGAVEPSVNGGGTRVRGFYEYVGPDGVTYRVDYTADENGFRPVGRHLPVLGAK